MHSAAKPGIRYRNGLPGFHVEDHRPTIHGDECTPRRGRQRGRFVRHEPNLQRKCAWRNRVIDDDMRRLDGEELFRRTVYSRSDGVHGGGIAAVAAAAAALIYPSLQLP